MKKVFLLLIAASSALAAMAQTPGAQGYSNNGHRKYTKDSLLMRWVLDVNFLAGGLTQDYTTHSSLANYNNSIADVSNTGGNLKFATSHSFGFDAQIGYFLGKKRHFGFGAGFMYLGQQGQLSTTTPFHVEYQATDNQGNTYRQLITSNGPIKEDITITNMNIPIVLKYKTRFSKRFGFAADAGVLINLQERNAYSSKASFDYEAIYKYTQGTQGKNGLPTTYDASATPNSNDVFYTKNAYVASDVYPTIQDYFSKLRNNGYNVGLGVKPNNNSGSVSYMTGSVGFLVQPSVNYYFSDMVALNVGVYYLYQPFKNTTNSSYMLTNKAGEYSSVQNTASAVNSQSYGINLGLRFFFGKAKDSDGDGIPDKDDWCPHVYGLSQFHGCPDTDGDGIPDNEDSCVKVPGIMKFHGCPDSDGDGIPDKEDACPYAPGPAQYHGCPDRDGDGIIDKDDLCPDKAGLAQFHGCPDTDGDGIPDNEDQCPTVAGPADNHGCPYPPKPPVVEETKVSTPILFETNKTVIHHSSYPVLDEAVKLLNEDKSSYIIVDGYTDITGKVNYNKALSLKRANAVKAHLVKLGINAKRIKVVGHGANAPAASNDTEEGRMENRRAVMHLNVGE